MGSSLIKRWGGGVKSEQWNELIMVMPEQIDERDVRLSPAQVEGLGSYSRTWPGLTVWNTKQQLQAPD